MKTVGRRSIDNRSFEKSEEIAKRFFESDAYSEFLMELCTNANAGAAFVNGIMPNDMAKRLQQGQSPATTEDIQASSLQAVLPTPPSAAGSEETPEQKYTRLLSDPSWIPSGADFAQMNDAQKQMAFSRKASQ